MSSQLEDDVWQTPIVSGRIAVFIVPVVDHWRVRTPPWTVYTLIGLNALVYVLTKLFSTTEVVALELGFVLGDFSLLRLFTSWFVHAGIWHLAWNMFFLFMFGCPVEQMLGHARTLAAYALAGVVSSFIYFFTPLGTHLLQIGASGAICGLVGAFGIILRRETVNLQFWFFIIRVGQKDVSALTAVILWLIADAVLGMLASMLGIVGGTGYAAHVSGLLAGVGFGMLWTQRQRRTLGAQRQPSAQSIQCPECKGVALLKVDAMYRCSKCARWLTAAGKPASR